MKAVIYKGIGTFSLEEIDRPVPESGDVLIKVHASGICTTDIQKAKYGRIAYGSVIGREASGEIVESKNKHHSVGERVIVYPYPACGTCFHCRNDECQRCEKYSDAKVMVPGAVAEYVLVPERVVHHAIIKLPNTVPYEAGVLGVQLSEVIKAMRHAGNLFLKNVAVVGTGAVGAMVTFLARLAGAYVIGIDPLPERREYAKKMGAHLVLSPKELDVVREKTGGYGADVVFMAVASASAVPEGLSILRAGGKIVIMGDFRDVPQPNLSLDPVRLLNQSTQIVSCWGASPEDIGYALNILNYVPDIRSIITHTFPLAQYKDAIETVASKKGLRVIIKME